MNRVEARAPGALAAIRRLAARDVDRVHAEWTRARALLQRAEHDVAQAASQRRALAEWARGANLLLDRAVHAHVLHGLGRSAQLQQQAVAKRDVGKDACDAAHGMLLAVQARQKALDRVAERVSLRRREGAAGKWAREMDERWLCAAHARGPGG